MTNADLAVVQATVHGHVQGVFFRAFVLRRAKELGVTGYVRNQPGGIVEVHAEGEHSQLKRLLDHLHTGPPAARVVKVESSWSEYTGDYSGFTVEY